MQVLHHVLQEVVDHVLVQNICFHMHLIKLHQELGLHGEKCGIGSIMMAKLQGQDWKKIVKTLKNVGAPTTAKQIGLKNKKVN